MRAIYQRELRAFFTSVTGWLFIAAHVCLAGLYFFAVNLLSGYGNVADTVSSILFLLLLTTPVLTMRILAEDRKQKTDQLILTAPVSVSGHRVRKISGHGHGIYGSGRGDGSFSSDFKRLWDCAHGGELYCDSGLLSVRTGLHRRWTIRLLHYGESDHRGGSHFRDPVRSLHDDGDHFADIPVGQFADADSERV